MTKQNLKMEAFYGGAWNDISSRVRVSDGVSVRRGQPDEGDSARPGVMSLTLDNRDGFALPSNPLSPFYDTGGRYTPVRCALLPGLTTGVGADVADSFTRTLPSSWGTADSGQVWSGFFLVSGGTSAVASGSATHTIAGAGSAKADYLPSVSMQDGELLLTSITAPQATGGDLEVAGVIYRAQSISVYGMVRLHLTTSNAVQVRAYRAANGAQLGSTYTTGITHTGTGQPLSMRVRVVGKDVSVKVWVASGGEPAAYQVSFTDPSPILAGWVGVRTGRAGGNTNTGAVGYSAFAVTQWDVRFTGEINSWTPLTSGNFAVSNWYAGTTGAAGDAWTEAIAGGILHRLNAGKDPLRSSAYRGITALSPKAYWPMDDPAGSTSISSAVATSGPMVIKSGTVNFLGAELAPWLGDSLSGEGGLFRLDGLIDYPTGASAGWTGGVAVSNLVADADPAVASQIGFQFICSESTSDRTDFTLQINGAAAGGSIQLYRLTYSGASVSSTTLLDFPYTSLFDGGMHWVTLYVADSGANVNWNVLVDDVSFASGTLVTVDYNTPKRVFASGSGAVTIGHLSVFDGFLFPSDAYDAVFGYSGETPAARFLRLTGEEGVASEAIGSSSSTMGPQRQKTLVSLLNECARTDDAVMYEPASWLGLVMRTRASVYNQTPALAAGYTTHSVKRVLPILDTKNVRNDVTVQNANGRDFRAVTSSGPSSVALIGRVTDSVDVNLSEAAGPPQMQLRAGWELSKGSSLAARYPSLVFDVGQDPTLVATVGRVEIGNQISLSGLEPEILYQVVRAVVEMIGSHTRTIGLQGVDATVWRPGSYDDATRRYDSGSSTLTTGYSSTATSFSVTTTNPRDLWTQTPAHFPFDVTIAGERVRVTNITGSTSPQTFTVTRSVNGVVKAQASGAKVSLSTPGRYAL